MLLLPLAHAQSVSPEAAALVAAMRSHTGDPYATEGLRFSFVVGELRRDHRWDVKQDRIEVTFPHEGQRCTVRTTVAYAGADPLQRKAWELFVNDQFWLLAPAKVADPGAVVERTPEGLSVRYEGVGVTPGDAYRYELADDGEVRAWSFQLASGRSGRYAWAPATAVGPLRLSLTRSAEDRVIRFEDVAVEPIHLGEPATHCQ